IDAALKIASMEGLGGLTIGSLAKAVGMSKSGLFAHFNSKDRLQLTVLEMAVRHFTDTVLVPAFRQPRGVARIRAMFENWIDYMDDGDRFPGGSILIAASTEVDDRPGPLRDYTHQVQKDLID